MASKAAFFTSPLKSEALKNRILELGAHEVGIGDVSVGIAPELSHMPLAISLALKHPTLQAQDSPAYPYSQFSLATDRRLIQIQRTITREIRHQGWRALAIPPDSYRHDSTFISRIFNLFPHKTAATCAGLGWIGKSGLLINSRFGPRLTWATILTNAPLTVDVTPIRKSFCGQCRCCVEACPANAIKDRNWEYTTSYRSMVNGDKCAAELEKNKEHYGQYACGICMLVCPKGLK